MLCILFGSEIKQRMAGNGWMYSGRISPLERSDEWVWRTDFLVKELARGSKAGLRPFCPCTRCGKRQRKGKDDMIKHLWSYGYMPGFTTTIDFAEHERESGRVMRQRINGNADDGIRNFLNDLRDAHMPDSPPSYEEPRNMRNRVKKRIRVNLRNRSLPRRPTMI